MSHRVVLLGAPASGKGTHARALSASLRVPHVSTGQLFRDAARRGGTQGRQIAEFIDKGHLVPDEMTIEVVRDWLHDRGREPEFIFDGFPRTLAQAEAFDAMLAERQLPPPLFIFLDVSEDEILSRVLGRLGCENCGRLYHEQLDPPQQTGICDKCGHPLERRGDDVQETVRERMRQYRELTVPVIEYYDRSGRLQRVDSSRPKQQVFADVLRIAKS